MAAVKFRIRPKKNLEKLTAIHCNYYHEGIEIELSTGLKVLPANWSNSRVSIPKNKINKLLADKESALLNLHIDHHGKSKEELENLARAIIKGSPVSTSREEKKTLIQGVQQLIAQYEREKEAGTVNRYRALLTKLQAFKPGITFENLDHGFYDGFKNFLHGVRNPNFPDHHIEYNGSLGCYLVSPGTDTGDPVGLFDDTVYKYLVHIKTVCTWAEKRGYNPNDSVRSWEIIKRDYTPITLSKEELEKIESLTLPKHLDIARDYLALECRTGQRISDLRRFNAKDLDGDVWTFFQKKGNRIKAKLIELPLEGHALPGLLILQKYNFNLPKVSEQKLNKHIKTVCKEAGIDEEMYIERWAGNKKIRIPGKKYEFISTHTGKKSFITILASEGIPVSILSILTGTSQKTIERHYLGRIQLSKVREHLRKAYTPNPLMKLG